MSEDYYIPLELQSEIIKRLPVKSLVQFRSVSKQWKSLIDNPKFIKTYHINHLNPQHHLLVRYKLAMVDRVRTYTSIIDDNTFPQQKFPLTIPEPLNLLSNTTILGSVDGLICFYSLFLWIVVLWNPSVRKSVRIGISNVYIDSSYGYTRIGFGVCPVTNDHKLVQINVVETPTICWEVKVFTLSSRAWKTVYSGAPFTSFTLTWDHVCIDGIIYWRSSRGSFLISFDLKSDKFGEVCLPERLAIPSDLKVAKVNESLGLLEYYEEGGMSVCGVWMTKDGVNKPFTNIYTVKVEGKSVHDAILGFRKNGEVVMEIEDDVLPGSHIEVYEPSSGRIHSVGINGYYTTFSMWSYMETLLLLDESNSIIH